MVIKPFVTHSHPKIIRHKRAHQKGRAKIVISFQVFITLYNNFALVLSFKNKKCYFCNSF
jgi:hypothetical protein